MPNLPFGADYELLGSQLAKTGISAQNARQAALDYASHGRSTVLTAIRPARVLLPVAAGGVGPVGGF